MEFPPVHNLVAATFEHQKMRSPNGTIEPPAKAPQPVAEGKGLLGDGNVLNTPEAPEPGLHVGTRLNAVA